MIELNGKEVHTFRFPAGEVGLKINNIEKQNSIYAEINSSDDLMSVLLLSNAVKEGGGDIAVLKMPYIPYGRQDRVCYAGEPFSLRVVASLINSIGATQVLTLDPHSMVTSALVNNLVAVDDLPFLPADPFDVLVSPDAGAIKRSQRHAEYLSLPIVQCLKTRVEGRILKTSLHGDVTGKRCLITDDICDGGATFVALADALRNGGASYIHLHVSHGIFSNGKQYLLERGIDSISSINYKEVFK